MKEKIVLYLIEIAEVMQGINTSSSYDSFLGDDKGFKELARKNITLRAAFDWVEELADHTGHGLVEANGIPINEARKLFPNKCLEMLVAGGMKFEDAMQLMPKFVLS
jgi:hypothetical protein